MHLDNTEVILIKINYPGRLHEKKKSDLQELQKER